MKWSVIYTTLILRSFEVARLDTMRASNNGPSKNQAVVVQDCFNLCRMLFSFNASLDALPHNDQKNCCHEESRLFSVGSFNL